MNGALIALLAALAILRFSFGPRRGYRVNDLSRVDPAKRPPPPAPMRRAGIELPYRGDRL